MPWASRLHKLQAVLTKRKEDVTFEETTRKRTRRGAVPGGNSTARTSVMVGEVTGRA